MADGFPADSVPADRPLTDEEFGVLQHYIDAIMERMAADRFTLVVERDFAGLMEFLESVQSPLRNPTFDPSQSDLSRDAFWLRVIDENGTTVACHAERAFEIDSYDELVRSGKLWHRDGMTWGGERVPELTIKKSMDQINGRVTHAGSMWVRPAARKRGLSLYLPYLSRALFLRNYEVRYLSGFVLSSLAGSRVPRTAYGFPHMEEYLSGWFPPTRRHEEKVFICYQNRVEAMERFRALPFHPEFPVQAPAAEAKVAVPSDLEVGKRPRVDADN